MKTIGLTGGIGTGKTAVADILRNLGWVVLSSDQTAAEIMNSMPEVRQQIAGLLGADVLTTNGINRKAIAALVFGNTEASRSNLKRLNSIVHPHVLDAHRLRLEALASEGHSLAVVESALLYEVGLEDAFDYVIVVDAPEQLCIDRAKTRSGLTEQQVRDRMAYQIPTTDKRKWADFVIENTGTLDALATTTKKLAAIIELLPETNPSE